MSVLSPSTWLSVVAAVVLVSGCVSSAPPDTAATEIGEQMYVVHPWAETEPVNITGRMNALQGALAGVSSAQQAYFDFKMAQADAFNRRAFLKAEYARNEAALRRQREKAAEAARLRALAEQDTQRGRIAIKPPKLAASPEWDSSGWDFGVAIAGWVGMQDDALRNMRVEMNTQARPAPPPPPPPRRTK
ncbi:MAG: hypothetical protein ACWA5T_06820 [Parvularcula sp.]